MQELFVPFAALAALLVLLSLMARRIVTPRRRPTLTTRATGALFTRGTQESARQRGERTRYRASTGVRFTVTIFAPVFLAAVNHKLLEVRGTQIPTDLTPWIAGAILAVTLYAVIAVWAYAVEIENLTIRVPGRLLLRRDYDLSYLQAVSAYGPHHIRLHFFDGRRVSILKYLAGRDHMMRHLVGVVSINASLPPGAACRNSPKSKRSVVA